MLELNRNRWFHNGCWLLWWCGCHCYSYCILYQFDTIKLTKYFCLHWLFYLMNSFQNTKYILLYIQQLIYEYIFIYIDSVVHLIISSLVLQTKIVLASRFRFFLCFLHNIWFRFISKHSHNSILCFVCAYLLGFAMLFLSLLLCLSPSNSPPFSFSVYLNWIFIIYIYGFL